LSQLQRLRPGDSEAIDPDDEEEPCDPNKCPPDPNCTVGDPVYPASGKFYVKVKDFEINGKTDRFTEVADRLYESPAGVYESIVEELDGTYALSKPNGRVVVHNNDGTPKEIRNVAGDQLLFTYDPAGKLPTTVSASGSALDLGLNDLPAQAYPTVVLVKS